MEQYTYLEENNITIDHFKFKEKHLNAVYLKLRDRDFIGVDYSKIHTFSEERCIIAHEIGHYETGTVYTDETTPDELSRQEYRADKRAIGRLLPYSTLKAYIDKYKPNYSCEIAEEFCITEDFVNKALKLYSII